MGTDQQNRQFDAICHDNDELVVKSFCPATLPGKLFDHEVAVNLYHK